MSKKKNKKKKNIMPQSMGVSGDNEKLTPEAEETSEDNSEEAEVKQIVRNAISEDGETEEAPDAAVGTEEDKEPSESSESQYSEEAREEFEKAQKEQAKKKQEARREKPERTKEDEEKRLARHKRRIRNQVIAYITVIALVIIVFGGGSFAVKYFVIDAGLFKKPVSQEIVTGDDNNSTDLTETADTSDLADNTDITDITDPEDTDTVTDGEITGDLQTDDTVIDTEEPVEVIPEEDPNEKLDEYVDGLIAGMTLEQKVAGIIMTSPEALTKVNLATMAGEGTKNALEKYAVGGIIYDSRNVTSHDQFKAMITGTIGMVTSPTFFAIAEEGGRDNSPLAKVDFYETALGAKGIVETNDVANAYSAGSQIGVALSEIGINVDLAPIADLSSEAMEKLDGRTFGTSAMDTIGYVSQMEDGLEAGGVTSCLKYFPGQGYATTDPAAGRTVIDKSEEDFRSGDFLVYQECIENGSKMIMLSNAIVTAFDDTQPATMSQRVVTDILRNELGFDGVILSGNLSDISITDYYSPDEAAILSLKAGCDMILNPFEFETAYDGIIKAVGDGVISEERINDALKRIYRIKYAGSV